MDQMLVLELISPVPDGSEGKSPMERGRELGKLIEK